MFEPERLKRARRRALETRTDEWRQVGLAGALDPEEARRARTSVVIELLLIAAILVAFSQQKNLFPSYETEAQIVTVALLVIVGWALARSLGRFLAPFLYRRIEPGMAGTVGFLIRLVTMGVMIVIGLRIAGVEPGALAVGGAFTAVVVGLAAQQTVGNLFAGVVLISTRPFRVGERVRLVGGALAGQQEGIVGEQGLFYTTLVAGADRIMVPNSMVLNVAIVPLREPDRVELRARVDAGTTPAEVEEMLREAISTPTRYPPHIALEEIDRDGVVVRIVATPERASEGGDLAAEIMAAVGGWEGKSRNGNPVEAR